MILLLGLRILLGYLVWGSSCDVYYWLAKQHLLNFLPLPQGHGSLRPPARSRVVFESSEVLVPITLQLGNPLLEKSVDIGAHDHTGKGGEAK